MKKIIILGASGASLEILSLMEDINLEKAQYELIGFLDDNIKKVSKENRKKILGNFKFKIPIFKDVFFTTAFGNEKNFLQRKKIIKSLKIPRNRFANIIHPTSIISKSAQIGRGVVIHPQVYIGNRVKIFDQVVILPKVSINHDTIIKSYSIINTNVTISGNVNVEENCYLGAGCNIRDHITIKKNNLIGMGSVVVKNPEFKKSIYLGNPAKLYKKF